MARINRDMGTGGNWFEKQLGQLRPGDTNAASLYSPPTGIVSTQVTTLIICNTSSSAATYRVFLDIDGTTYDQTTALFYDISLPAYTTDSIEPNGMFMNNSAGNLAVRSGTTSALTFTAYGIEILTRQA